MKILALFFISLMACVLIVSFYGSAYAATGFSQFVGFGGTTTGIVTGDPQTPITTTTGGDSSLLTSNKDVGSIFYPNEQQVVFYVDFGVIPQVNSVLISWFWYQPNGEQYRFNSYLIPSSSTGYDHYIVWDTLYIAGTTVSTLPGDWTVKVVSAGPDIPTEVLFNVTFTMAASSPSESPSLSPSIPEFPMQILPFFVSSLLFIALFVKYAPKLKKLIFYS